MKKTITCATTSLLLIGILTLQTLAINFKSEENIDNLVFPFIYSDADDLVWVRKYVGDCSTCIEGRLYVKDMVTGEVKEIVSDAVKQLRESEDTLYCITNDGLSIIQTDCQGKKVTEIYKADYGMIDHLEVYGNNLCFTEGDYVVSFDLKKSEKTVVGRGANVLYLYPLTETEFVWVTGENGEASVYDSITNEVIDVEHIELLQINGKGNVHFNELDTVKDVTPQAILQETFPLSNYPVGSYFTVNGRACTDHGSGSCSTTGGCNCKSYDSSIQCMGFAKYASDQYAHRGSWSYTLYGDNVIEKHGINRDSTGDREKTRYLCGKQGIFTRDRALIRPGFIRQLETRASTRSASFFHALGSPGRPHNGGGEAGAYRTRNGAKPLKQGHLRAKRGPLGPSRKSQQQTKRTGFAAHGHSIAETAPEGKRASCANGALIRA